MENEKKERLYVRIEQRLFWFIIGALFNAVLIKVLTEIGFFAIPIKCI